MISVRAIKQMLSGQVDYRYKADTMQMGRFISLDNLKDQKFDPSQHIAIEKIIVNGLSKNMWVLGSRLKYLTICFLEIKISKLASNRGLKNWLLIMVSMFLNHSEDN